MTDYLSDDSIDFDQVLSREGTESLKWDKYKGRDVLPFWVADMDFPVAPVILRALHERLAHPVFGYAVAPAGLNEAIMAHLANEYGWTVSPEWLVHVAGVVPGLGASVRATCSDGDEVMTNPPIYHHFFDAHEMERQALVQVPLRRAEHRWTYDIEAMRAAMNERTRLLMLCSPHNPVGTVFSSGELQAVIGLAAQHDTAVVSDEIHCDLVLDPQARHVPTAVACPEYAHRIITLMSASKTWNIAGLNCSFAVISDPVLRNAFKSACQSTVPPVPPLAYVATEAAYRDGGPWRAALLEYLRGNMDCLGAAFARLPGMTLEPLEATYLAWLDVRGLNLNDPQGWFEERGVGMSGGEQFGRPGYLRLNFACPRSTLKAGLQRIEAAVASIEQ